MNGQQVQHIEDASGEATFRRLPDGSRIPDSWALVLPFVERYVRQAVPGSVNRAGVRTPSRPVVVLAGIGWRTSGGGVTRLRSGEETIRSADDAPAERQRPAVPER